MVEAMAVAGQMVEAITAAGQMVETMAAAAAEVMFLFYYISHQIFQS